MSDAPKVSPDAFEDRLQGMIDLVRDLGQSVIDRIRGLSESDPAAFDCLRRFVEGEKNDKGKKKSFLEIVTDAFPDLKLGDPVFRERFGFIQDFLNRYSRNMADRQHGVVADARTQMKAVAKSVPVARRDGIDRRGYDIAAELGIDDTLGQMCRMAMVLEERPDGEISNLSASIVSDPSKLKAFFNSRFDWTKPGCRLVFYVGSTDHKNQWWVWDPVNGRQPSEDDEKYSSAWRMQMHPEQQRDLDTGGGSIN